jgi:hypothetical protein
MDTTTVPPAVGASAARRHAQSSHEVQQAILQAIYAVFLGGVMTAFVAVGLFTFYPTPDTYSTQIVALEQRESAIYSECKTGPCTLTAEQNTELRAIETERTDLYRLQEQEQQGWNRVAGIIMIVVATALLAISLVRWDRAIVISNGLLLGGLFTMVFGIGLTLAGGDNIMRFVVLTVALIITVVLGYLRFARGPRRVGGKGTEVAAAAPTSVEVADLDDRVANLEARLADMHRALGG